MEWGGVRRGSYLLGLSCSRDKFTATTVGQIVQVQSTIMEVQDLKYGKKVSNTSPGQMFSKIQHIKKIYLVLHTSLSLPKFPHEF